MASISDRLSNKGTFLFINSELLLRNGWSFVLKAVALPQIESAIVFCKKSLEVIIEEYPVRSIGTVTLRAIVIY